MTPVWLHNLHVVSYIMVVSSLMYYSCLMMLFIAMVYGSVWESIAVKLLPHTEFMQLTIIACMHDYTHAPHTEQVV